MRIRLHVFSLILGLLLACVSGAEASNDQGVTDEQTVKAAGLSTVGPALLDFFRKRTAAVTGREHLQTLVQQLGDPTASVREKAAAELVSWGPVAIPFLLQSAQDPDSGEVARRARRCLEALTGETKLAIPTA